MMIMCSLRMFSYLPKCLGKPWKKIFGVKGFLIFTAVAAGSSLFGYVLLSLSGKSFKKIASVVSHSQADTSGPDFTKICIISAQNLGQGVGRVLRQAVTAT